MELSWTTWVLIASAAALVYIFGAVFTEGVRLWPRKRGQGGRIVSHPLHRIEALGWPVAWPVFWVIGFLQWFLQWGFALLWWLLESAYNLGERAGNAPSPSDRGTAQRRLEDFRDQVEAKRPGNN